MKYFFTVFIFFTATSFFAQDSEVIITPEQNAQWLHELKDRDLAEKLEMIKWRWGADTAVVYYPTAIPHEKASGDIRKTKSLPLYLFVNRGNKLIIFPSNPTPEVIAEVSKMLIPKNIPEVLVQTEPKEVVIYGTRGLSGIIYLKVPEDSIYEGLKEVLRQ